MDGSFKRTLINHHLIRAQLVVEVEVFCDRVSLFRDRIWHGKLTPLFPSGGFVLEIADRSY